MFSSVVSGAVYGVHSYLMHIETDISDGLPMFTMVGFVSAQVREAGERVRVAMRNTGIHLPPKRITVNLTPAEIPKRDVIADLPVNRNSDCNGTSGSAGSEGCFYCGRSFAGRHGDAGARRSAHGAGGKGKGNEGFPASA